MVSKQNNIAYYLKYRPQALSDLIGQESVKNTLTTAFKASKLSHAYLFVGPRGTGKTSTARILAKMVNCESLESSYKSLEKHTDDKSRLSNLATSDHPCNECPTCISITDGSNMDLIEIDAASNRGIEDIRSLRDKIKLAPTSSKKKVYIIDEVHMLTTEAFNALLKTLEEPPTHALFILATTNESKIPQTIMSRVQRLDFKLASTDELMDALNLIVNKEKIDIDEEALKMLIKKSDGSFRDGVKLLDQVSSMEEKITGKVLQKFFKSSNFDEVLELLESFSKRDTALSLSIILKQVENGVDIKEYILSLMDGLRSLVFIKNGLGEQLVKPQFSLEKYENLNKLAESLSSKELIRFLNILQTSLEKLKFSPVLSLPLELAAIEICAEVKPVETLEVKKLEVVVEDSESKVEKEIGDRPSLIHPLSSESDIPEDILKIKEKWTFVLETIRPVNFSLEALLRSINVKQCTDTEVFMEVPYSFHQRILEAPKNRDLLEGVLSDVLGRSIKVLVILGNRPTRKEDIANIEVAADDEIIRAAAEIFNSDTIN